MRITGIGSTAADLVGSASCYIDGRWVEGDSGISWPVVNPATEELLAQVPAPAASQVDKAVRSARAAFERSRLSRWGPRERAEAIRRLASLMDSKRDSLVEVIVSEVGTPISLARSLQVGSPIEHMEGWADVALRGPACGWRDGLDIHTNPVPSSGVLVREPIGVVAGIVAYNYPLLLTVFKLAPAIAAGCSIVIMPSPRAPLSVIALMHLVEEADIPRGLVNLVTGAEDVGRQLTEHRDVDMVSFTGSVKVGSAVMAQSAATVKRVVLELGGKSPNIMLPGVDVEAVVAPSILRYARNAGQGCGSTTRILVPRADYEPFIESAAKFMAESVTTGDPWDEKTDVGPLIRAEQRASVEAYVERAVASGGEVVAGGGRPAFERGFFMNPSLVAGVSNESEICQEELFGPVGVVLPYDTVDEAIELANGTRYGLNALVWGPTLEALAVAERLKSGTVAINGGGGQRIDAPWSGVSQSGLGYENGEDGFLEFFSVKHIQWPVVTPPVLKTS